QHFAGRLDEAGLIEEVVEKQVYSNADGRFLPDRYIEGTCPEPGCDYDKARGDQCEVCTRQLEPTELINPRSAISGSTDLEIRETKHLYLKQSQMRAQLSAWIDSKKNWPILTTSIAKKWLNDGDGLQDRGITRDLDWGIPVKRGDADWPGMEGKVFYVWFDAPIEYIACAGEWVDAGKGEDWERWWRTDKGAHDVTYTQFMGKDNVPFHTLSFPATILGSAEPWKLVDYIKSFNYLNYDGGQFSTSQGRGVFIDQALEILPADYWRWWLLSHAPESSDSEFTWENFQASVNKDLADVLGNFVSRVTKFCRSKFGEVVPEGGELGAQEIALIEELTKRIRAYEDHMEAIEVRKSANELRAIWVAGNEYLQAAAPWAVFKENPEQAAMQIRLALNLIRIYAVLSAPFVPDAAKTMLEAMKTEDTAWPEDVKQALSTLTAGHEFAVPDVLFAKISDEEREGWQQKFAGQRT
ncbi:MAG: methionine--tRNA ligase, partial [Pseudomonadota bacterium]